MKILLKKIKRKKIINNCIFCAIIFLLLTSCSKDGNENNIAIVDGKGIAKELFIKELEFYQDFYTKKYGDNYLEKKDKHGKSNKEKLQENLLDSMVKDKVMLNDLESKKISIDDNRADQLRSQLEKTLGDRESLKANIKALNISDSDFNDIIFNDSIRKIHYENFLASNKINDSEILEYYKANENLHRMYKYNVLVFDDANQAKIVRDKIKSYKDFRNRLSSSVRNYSIINSDFVYKDDPILSLSKLDQKNVVSDIFEYNKKYMILMINSYNDNENELLLHTKDIYLKNAYDDYLNKLTKSSKIRLFI